MKANSPGPHLAALTSPFILTGGTFMAFRDPALVVHKDRYYLYYSLVRTEEDDLIYWYVALSTSDDLIHWSSPKVISPRGQHLNFSSPGNVIRFGNEWLLSTQTYPQHGARRWGPVQYGHPPTNRVYLMRSRDLINWGEPEWMRVKGPNVSYEAHGSMIDSYFLEDKDEPGKWWCLFKDHNENGPGMGCSWTRDFVTWNYHQTIVAGENVCALVIDDEYWLYHSPHNGIGLMKSRDLTHWDDVGEPLTFGQKDWPCAETRVTAGYVCDLREHPDVGRYVMLFHTMGPGKERHSGNVNANCHIAIAWSHDLKDWDWPGKGTSVAYEMNR